MRPKIHMGVLPADQTSLTFIFCIIYTPIWTLENPVGIVWDGMTCVIQLPCVVKSISYFWENSKNEDTA